MYVCVYMHVCVCVCVYVCVCIYIYTHTHTHSRTTFFQSLHILENNLLSSKSVKKLHTCLWIVIFFLLEQWKTFQTNKSTVCVYKVMYV